MHGWSLNVKAATAIAAVLFGAASSLVVIIAGPAGQAPDSAAAIVAGLLSALAVLLHNTSDGLPAEATSGTGS